MFGCDVCQDLCPWNRFSTSHKEPLFNTHPELLSKSKKEWQEMLKEVFQEIFNKNAVKRNDFKGLIRNINF
jgi:epoxyqueuosine reductase